MTGRFVTLEGGEGVGKSTQVERLADALRSRGIAVVATREPGGSDGAETIRSLLLDGGTERWGPRAEALLFAAARADHVARTIRPAIASGAWVLCDRFVDSSRAYQGGPDALSDADLIALHRIGSDGLMPDRTLVLTLPTEQAIARAVTRDGAAADRIGGRGVDYHDGVARRFRALADAEPLRVRLVDASGPADQVTGRLVAELADLMPS